MQYNQLTNVDAPGRASRTKHEMAPMWGADGNKICALSPDHVLMPYEPVTNDMPVPQFSNGRVVGIDNIKSGNQFPMFTQNNNNSDTAKDTILYGTLSRTPLSDVFFSKANMQLLQNMLRYRVYMASGGKYNIGEQNNNDLLIIQRAVYLQYSKNLPSQITEQIRELNRMVIDYCLPKVISEIKQYLYYINDIQHLPQMIDLPRNLSSKGTRTLSSVTTTY